MDQNWSPDLIADIVVRHCKQKESLEGPKGRIDMIVTFDEGGVSGHPNHCAIFHGASQIMRRGTIDVELWTLTSVNILRKYIGLVDIHFIWHEEWQCSRLNTIEAYLTLAEHATQLVWFRKLFIIFSRYTYLNSFTRYVQDVKKANVAADKDKDTDEDNVIDESGKGSSKKRTKVNID